MSKKKKFQDELCLDARTPKKKKIEKGKVQKRLDGRKH